MKMRFSLRIMYLWDWFESNRVGRCFAETDADTVADTAIETIALLLWCPGPESNRHALRRGILSPV